MKNLKNRIVAVIAVLVIAAPAAIAGSVPENEGDANIRLSKRVRKELVTLPFYGVFDNLEFKIEDAVVTLSGQVVRPITRKDAERRVAKLKGVESVINNIEVLPLSSFDNSIRRSTYRAVFGTAGLYGYSLGTNPSLRIIVRRGNVILEGIVNSEMHKRLAFMAANGVSGVFSVTNNLRVTGKRD